MNYMDKAESEKYDVVIAQYWRFLIVIAFRFVVCLKIKMCWVTESRTEEFHLLSDLQFFVFTLDRSTVKLVSQRILFIKRN